MDETDDRHGALEDATSGGSDCEARGTSGSEVDGRSGEVGIVSRDQKEVFRIELMSRRVKTGTNVAERGRTREGFAPTSLKPRKEQM